MFKVADFFCGAGGFSEGFRQAGFQIIYAVDNWNTARLTHKLNHPDCSHPGLDCDYETEGNILNLTPIYIANTMPDVEVIIGSPPCISFSTSNKAGKADKTLGIKLIKKFLQIIAIKKNKSHSILKYWLMENVPNSQYYIEEAYTFADLDLDAKTLHEIGIKRNPNSIALTVSQKGVFKSVEYGVPQKRERFVCGDFPEPPRKITDPAEWVTLGKVISALKRKGAITDPNYNFSIPNNQLTDHFYETIIPKFEWEEAKIKKQQARYYGKMSFPEDESKPSRTIMATRSVLSRESMILPNGHPGNFRSPTVREVASIMSFPITYQFQANNEASKYRLVGNAVCPKLSLAFAEEILKQENIKPKYSFNPKTDLTKLIVNLRTQQPPHKKPRDKQPRANFAEIVPDLKHKNFRVELDNHLPRDNNRKIKWQASIHHGTGVRDMKKAEPTLDQINKIFNQFNDYQKVADFVQSVKKAFTKKIPKTLTFQEQHILASPNHKYFTPRKSLNIIKNLVDHHFPVRNFKDVCLTNNVNGKSIIKFNPDISEEGLVPIRIIAALYACHFVATQTQE